MKRLILALLAALLTALGAVPHADAGIASKKREIVCFKKTFKTTSGRKVKRQICRPRRKAVPKPKIGPVMPGPTLEVPVPEAAPASPSAPAPVVTATPAPAAPACVPEDSPWLTATALDVNQKFVLRLSRTCLRAGRTIVRLQNEDAQPHDLWAEGIAPKVAKREITSADLKSMSQADADFTAGTWRLFCSIPGHGTMSRTVDVID